MVEEGKERKGKTSFFLKKIKKMKAKKIRLGGYCV